MNARRPFLLSALFLFPAAPAALAATSSSTKAAMAAPSMPNCNRPEDFSISKDVATYEECLRKRQDYCENHERDLNCRRVSEGEKKRKVWAKTTDIDTQAHCFIQRDGSYQCDQEPVRFIFSDEEPAPPPQPAPSSPNLSDGGIATTPATGGLGAPAAPGGPAAPAAPAAGGPPPPVVPPPPPGK